MIDEFVELVMRDKKYRKDIKAAISALITNSIHELSRSDLSWQITKRLEDEVVKALKPELDRLIEQNREDIRKVVGDKYD